MESVPSVTGAPLVITTTLKMMVSWGAGQREAFFDFPERRGLSLEACPTLEVGSHAWGGMRLGVKSPLEVASLLLMGLAAVWRVGALDVVALIEEELRGVPVGK